MNYTAKELETIEEMGALFFAPTDIAILLEKDVDSFLNEIRLESSEAYKRYKLGWLTAEITLRKSVMQSAENGSNPAQVMMFELNKKNNYA